MKLSALIIIANGALLALWSQDAGRFAKLLQKSKVSLQQAAEIGQRASPDAKLFHVELEQDGARVVYSVDLALGTKSVNVLVDATTGQVVEKVDEDEDHSREVDSSRVTLLTAVASGLSRVPGTAVEAEMVVDGGQPRVNVSIVAGDTVSQVAIDGVTGKPLEGSRARGSGKAEPSPFTTYFHLDKGELGPDGVNPYFSLQPGHTLFFEGKDEGQDATLKITVLNETREIDGVVTRVIEENETLGGKVVEISRNFFAISKRTNSVYYFGEEVDIYRDGEVVKHDGAWISGVDGAKFGLIMPGTPLVGARYFQEIAPEVALDRAEILAVDVTFETPAGKFEACVQTEESTPLESGRERKTYAAGVGLLNDGALALVRFGRDTK